MEQKSNYKEFVRKILLEMISKGASDLYLKYATTPYFRIDGELVASHYETMTSDDLESIAKILMNKEQWNYFVNSCEMDLAHSIENVGRFRINVFKQRGYIGMVIRAVIWQNLSFEKLGMPPAVQQLAELPRGLILVTGTTGSGKSTTLAAMINHINKIRKAHIVTIEDPIEFLYKDEKGLVNQREVGFDTLSFSDALKHVLRQAPDVILIGEMRDLETISTAISAAETGHLVLSTLHTIDAVQTLERIVNYFPSYLHNQIRLELSLSLRGVISQRLLPRKDRKGRIPAVEIMINTPTIKKYLLEGRTVELPQLIEKGKNYGMQTFNQSLYNLIANKKVSVEDAMQYASNPEDLKLAISGIQTGTSGTYI